jgi:predicted metal-dependent HD superfamily phosphohydrolase
MRGEALGIITAGLDRLKLRFGPKGMTPLAYHNENHTKNVLQAAAMLADKAIQNMRINQHDKELLLIAAAWHDTEQALGSGKNEQASAAAAVEEMMKANIYSEKDKQKVAEIIMATQVRYDSNGAMTQSATENYLTQLMADADLASLGKPTIEYWENAKKLFSELNPDAKIDAETYNNFIASQVPFLEHHYFYTQEAKELFPHKQENIEYIKNLAES